MAATAPLEGRRGSIMAHLKAEAFILFVLVATFLAIFYRDAIVSRNVEFKPADSSAYAISAYSDSVEPPGNSRMYARADRPLAWACDLNPGYEWAFCAYELVFERSAVPDFQVVTTPVPVQIKRGNARGLDLSDFESIQLDISYRGPGKSMRLQLKNEDPRYSTHGVRATAKPNKFEFPVKQGRQTIVATPRDFSVPDWWLGGRNLPPEQSLTQFDNIVALELLTSLQPVLGRHDFEVHGITVRQSAIPEAQYYLMIIAAWVMMTIVFLVLRVRRIRRSYEERHRAQLEESRELEAAKSAAESASRAKSEFLANMSHELRTPLNAILGYAQLLRKGNADERQVQTAARTIYNSGDHLLTLITDILDLSKVEAGKLELITAPIDLRSCVEGVADMVRVRAEEKGLLFSCTVADDVPRLVLGDERRIRQVLINLLGNAVKFTQTGRIDLNVGLIGTSAGSARVRFEVRDTGAGIEPSHQAHIFQPFEQAGDRRGRASGTGLGLSISRRIVELLGGTIELESAPGEGSRFWFDIDLALSESDLPLAAGEAGIAAQRTVLVVDDEEANRSLLAMALDQMGFAVDEAESGEKALDRIQQAPPALVLMDIRMPGMDGDEAIRRLRADPQLARLPVIALSAEGESEVAERAIAAGADCFVPKPIDLNLLAARITAMLGSPSPARESAVAVAQSHETAFVAPPQDRIEALFDLALAGRMSAIVREADAILALGEEYRPFAERLRALATSYQSPAVLQLIESHRTPRKAA